MDTLPQLPGREILPELADAVEAVMTRRHPEFIELVSGTSQGVRQDFARRNVSGPGVAAEIIERNAENLARSCEDLVGELVALIEKHDQLNDVTAKWLIDQVDRLVDGRGGVLRSVADQPQYFHGAPPAAKKGLADRAERAIMRVKNRTTMQIDEAVKIARLKAKTTRPSAEIDARPSADADDMVPKLMRKAAFERDVNQLLETWKTEGCPVAMVMMDGDGFKRINDELGHAVGDEVIKAVGAIVARRVLHRGRGYRFGGDEFSLMLANHSADEAALLAESLRKEVEAAVFGSATVKLTASFGVAAFPDHATEGKALLEAADQALYQAKRLGGNCVRIHGEPASEAPAARVVVRRVPDPDAMSDEQKEHLRQKYFRKGVVQCPRDGAWLRVEETGGFGRRAADIFVTCPICGLQEEFRGPA